MLSLQIILVALLAHQLTYKRNKSCHHTLFQLIASPTTFFSSNHSVAKFTTISTTGHIFPTKIAPFSISIIDRLFDQLATMPHIR